MARTSRGMDIFCIGGGPAGLYFSILMKLRDPRHRIRVIERNAADDTFGWGVVFSDETLVNLAAADPATYDEITRSFAHWDAIDVHVQGETLVSRGHGFSGLARAHLFDPNWTRDAAQARGYPLPWPDQYASVARYRPRFK